MARVKGGLFTTMLDVSKRFPLDSRMLVTKREDLINPATWTVNTLAAESTYNVMIVSVNSDGKYNGVYYLIDRRAITEENYLNYKTALSLGVNTDPYFSMWMKLGTLEDVTTIENRLMELIGDVPEGKTLIDMISSVTPNANLKPVDGTIVIDNADDGSKTIGVSIAPIAGNALIAVEGGLFVPEMSIQIADNAHGLVAVDGVLMLNLSTEDSDGAMSKEDKKLLGELENAVALLNQVCSWIEI